MHKEIENSIRRGLRIDVVGLEGEVDSLTSRIAEAEIELRQHQQFDVKLVANSSKSCRDYFQNLHGIPLKKADKVVMRNLASRGLPEPLYIIKVRTLIKEKSTLTSALKMVRSGNGVIEIENPCNKGITGRIFPKPGVLTFPMSFREYVIPEEGYYFISADYRSQELMIIAKVSGQQEFIDDIARGYDPFVNIQGQVGVEKGSAKAIVYGRMYGQRDEDTAYTNDISMDAVVKVKTAFDKMYPKMYAFILSRKAFIRQNSYAQTFVSGRTYNMRRIPDMEEELRRAVNFEVQGSGADILDLILESDKVASLKDRGIVVKFPIFDALLFQVDSRFVVQAQEDIKKMMESIPASMGFPQIVRTKTGMTWREVAE